LENGHLPRGGASGSNKTLRPVSFWGGMGAFIVSGFGVLRCPEKVLEGFLGLVLLPEGGKVPGGSFWLRLDGFGGFRRVRNSILYGLILYWLLNLSHKRNETGFLRSYPSQVFRDRSLSGPVEVFAGRTLLPISH